MTTIITWHCVMSLGLYAVMSCVKVRIDGWEPAAECWNPKLSVWHIAWLSQLKGRAYLVRNRWFTEFSPCSKHISKYFSVQGGLWGLHQLRFWALCITLCPTRAITCMGLWEEALYECEVKCHWECDQLMTVGVQSICWDWCHGMQSIGVCNCVGVCGHIHR